MPDHVEAHDFDGWTEEKINSLTAWTLIRTYHVVSRRLAAVCASAEIGPTQFGVLAHLAASPRLTQAELARRTLVTPQSMGDLVSALANRGMITKDGPGGRGRPARIQLTELGRNTLEMITVPVMLFNDPNTFGISAEESSVLNELLHSVRRTLAQ